VTLVTGPSGNMQNWYPYLHSAQYIIKLSHILLLFIYSSFTPHGA
jgi:hypothetical protein